MKRLILILVVVLSFTSCVKSQVKVLGRTPTYTPTSYSSDTLLIVFSGESNSGGDALNSAATSAELLPRSVQILNNQTLDFDSLRIGVNNLLGHSGYECCTATKHGWELGIANAYDSNTFNGRLVKIVKTGQGGSTMSQWGESSNYWDTMQLRVDTALSLLGGNPEVVLFYSQGINDILASTSTATWKSLTKAHIQKIRAKYGNIKIVMTDFHIIPTIEAYNATMAEIASEEGNMWIINTSAASYSDVYHWDYAGMKYIASLMINLVK